MESRLLGFPCFPYSFISMACFGNAFHKVTITANAGFGNRNHLSEMATIRPGGILTIAVPGHLWRVPTWRLDAPWRFAVP